MIRYFIIASKRREFFNESMEAFRKSVDRFTTVEVIEEFDSREETLNYIIENNKNCHIVCFADDIVLSDGWQPLIKKHLKGAISLGFCTYHPNKPNNINFGYDLIDVNGEVSTVARQSWSVTDFEFPLVLSECATFTGCFIAFSKDAINLLERVPLDGQNRLGELLYHVELKRLGGSVKVINHAIKHYGISTKRQSNDKNGSESYTVEKNIWDNACKKYKLTDFSKPISINVSDSLFDLPEDCVVWGAGSNAKVLFEVAGLAPTIYLSGLKEEDGEIFLNGKICYFKNYNSEQIKNLLITVDHLSDMIVRLVEANFNVENLYILSVRHTCDEKIFELSKYVSK